MLQADAASPTILQADAVSPAGGTSRLSTAAGSVAPPPQDAAYAARQQAFWQPENRPSLTARGVLYSATRARRTREDLFRSYLEDTAPAHDHLVEPSHDRVRPIAEKRLNLTTFAHFPAPACLVHSIILPLDYRFHLATVQCTDWPVPSIPWPCSLMRLRVVFK